MFIRRLRIRRYRGLENLTWYPSSRVNCLIGPGDSGKSTILSAIERLLDPRTGTSASEFDYFRRRVEAGFQITAVLGDLDEEFVASLRAPPLLGWLNRELKPLPDEDGAEPVLVARVTGSSDLDLTHELLTPSGAEDVAFLPGARRRLLFSRIASGGKAFSELRLGRGSLLERHVNATEFQGQLRSAAATALASLELPQGAVKAIEALSTLFNDSGLPEDLALGLITPQGWSLLSLLGLVEGNKAEEAVPLAFAGAGTRQLAMFRLAAGLMGASPLVVMDEPELGLEPYRQRKLIAEIREAVGDTGQAFLTTHSPAILEALDVSEVSRLAPNQDPVDLEGKHVQKFITEVPDSLLSRLPVLCEGDTEAGFLRPLLDSFAYRDGLGSIDALGIRLVSRPGQPQVLSEAEELLGLGLTIGIFVDAESEHEGRRVRLASNPRCAFGSWEGVRNIEEGICKWLSYANLVDIVQLAANICDRPKEALLQQVGQFIGSPGKADMDTLMASHTEADIRQALSQAMLSKGNSWFKTEARGRELGLFLLSIGLPEPMMKILHTFWQQSLELSGWVPKKQDAPFDPNSGA